MRQPEEKFMLALEIFGRSHEDFIGARAEGFPAGESIDLEELFAFMKRRAPQTRKEDDMPVFLSGLENGVTTGERLVVHIANRDCRPSDYEELKFIPRPGHADYPAYVKWKGEEDMRGGGKFSGRMTAPLCAIGGIAKQLLSSRGIEISSEIIELGGSREPAEFEEIILNAKREGDSVGGIACCRITGMPVGIGDCLFEGLESGISRLVFGIPAVKGIEFGSGFEGAALRGSENNDGYEVCNNKVNITSNNAGGILGGMSTGEPIVFNVAFKPVPSISMPQKSVDLEKMENVELVISGRHDVCVLPRALPAVEAAAAIAVFSAMDIREEQSLSSLRREIDSLDSEISALISKRFELTDSVRGFKDRVRDPSREEQVLLNVTAAADKYCDEIREIYVKIMEQSRKRQEELNG